MNQVNFTATKLTPVAIVGAGLGDPELITVKALKRIRSADVILYDRLLSEDLLLEASPHAELIFVGKHGPKDCVSWRQEDINSLLIAKAKLGLSVVRLKGGDPFVFGRGSEEALALKVEGLSFEIIPGISSAIAAPAYAGIPVTHRGLASSFTVVTGHEDPSKSESSLNWDVLAKVDTLVILMGVSRLVSITQKLIQHGRASAQPAALVHWASSPHQQALYATLATIAHEAEIKQFAAPATLIVGEVVALASDLAWLPSVSALVASA